MASKDINSVVVQGRLTRDAKYTQVNEKGGWMELSVAFNSVKKEGTNYVQVPNYVVVKSFTPPWMVEEALKGTMATVNGELSMEEWTGKDGNKVQRLVIKTDSFGLKFHKSVKVTKVDGQKADDDDIPFY